MITFELELPGNIDNLEKGKTEKGKAVKIYD